VTGKSSGQDWTDQTAPTLDDFEIMAVTAFQSLPQEFRDLMDGVPFMVADFPDEETLAEMECETEFDLLGLFYGTGLAHRGDTPQTGEMPNRIWLYRRPILDYWAEHDGEALGDVIAHVLIHEIGHHFGFSDDDLDAIEQAAAPEDQI
jgi:predicted Zn-dependent protease with MMP-like domain